ncbi:MAG: porin [Bacteroidota bacterium]
MKRLNKLMLLLALMPLSTGVLAQSGEDFKPSGKPIVKIFANYHSIFSDGDAANAFQITRAYLGYEYSFSKNFSGKIVLDVGDPGLGRFKLTAFLKNAYLKYNYKKFTVSFGMISTTAFKTQEKFWGYRYLYKSFQDAYRFNSSADLGISLNYRFTDFLSADFSIFNGEGYKLVQLDSTFQAALGVTVKPVDDLILRIYYDYMEKDAAQQTIALFAGYTIGKFSLGAEYDRQLNHGIIYHKDFDGYSVFATFKVNNKWKVFGRYDKLSSVKTDHEEQVWNLNRDGQIIIAGLEFNPVKGIKLTPNYQGWIPADADAHVLHGAFLNCEIKL